MAYEFKFPDVGEGITEGELIKWLISEGDSVKQDQPIAEVETDKAVVQIPSPRTGTILRLHHKAGDTIKVGEIIVTIGEKSEKVPIKQEIKQEIKPQIKEAVKKEEKKSFGVVGELEEATEQSVIHHPKKEIVKVVPLEDHVLATPITRRLARELNVDLSKVKGTGLNGRITEEDVRKESQSTSQPYIAESSSSAPKIIKKYDEFGYIEHIALKGVRKTTAKHMIESKRAIPHVIHMDEADVTELVQLREKEKKKAEKKGIKLTFMPFMVKAIVAALKNHPYLNASYDEEHEEIILKKYYNIGFAVDAGGGLFVPVIKGADQKSILDLADEIRRLANQTEERTIDLMELKGGTFTITNVGSIGGIFATPIINYPESAMLAVGKIIEKPVVYRKKIAIRSILPLSLAFDHRILDGAEAAMFMNDLIKNLEDPEMLLMEY